jgi:bifunctional DNA-binding transcriptional regulator/antitoxin component of YhaV-PrlF toxin-antitoxin module
MKICKAKIENDPFHTRLTVPDLLMSRYGWKKGDILQFEDRHGEIVVSNQTHDPIRSRLKKVDYRREMEMNSQLYRYLNDKIKKNPGDVIKLLIDFKNKVVCEIREKHLLNESTWMLFSWMCMRAKIGPRMEQKVLPLVADRKGMAKNGECEVY